MTSPWSTAVRAQGLLLRSVLTAKSREQSPLGGRRPSSYARSSSSFSSSSCSHLGRSPPQQHHRPLSPSLMCRYASRGPAHRERPTYLDAKGLKHKPIVASEGLPFRHSLRTLFACAPQKFKATTAHRVMDVEQAVRRKPRAGPLARIVRRARGFFWAYGPAAVRYGLMPSLIAASLYYTEPAPSLWELLNPFTR